MARPDPRRPLRVLHCPWNIAGQSASLSAAERELGLDSRCIAVQENHAGFPADVCLTKPGDGRLKTEVARYRLFWEALRWADVVHFSFGQSCFAPNLFPGFGDLSWRQPWRWPLRIYARAVWLKDVPLLRAAGKAVFVTWQGDDARQRDRSLELFETCIAREVERDYYPEGSDLWKRRAIAWFDRHVQGHYALNPDLLHVLPPRTQFLPYASFDPRLIEPHVPQPDASRPLRLVHAPSHRGAKGTHHLLAALDVLRSEGLVFSFEMVEGLSRDAALEHYREADVVVDQLLAGWYGGLAVEAMALGKVVVAYLREGDLGGIPLEMRNALPVISAEPASVARVLRDLLAMPRERLSSIGRAGRSFVEAWHDPRGVAKRIAADYVTAARGENRQPIASTQGQR